MSERYLIPLSPGPLIVVRGEASTWRATIKALGDGALLRIQVANANVWRLRGEASRRAWRKESRILTVARDRAGLTHGLPSGHEK